MTDETTPSTPEALEADPQRRMTATEILNRRKAKGNPMSIDPEATAICPFCFEGSDINDPDWRANALKHVESCPTHPMHAFVIQRNELLAALKVCRGQWIHSVNAKQCLAAIANGEKTPESTASPHRPSSRQ